MSAPLRKRISTTSPFPLRAASCNGVWKKQKSKLCLCVTLVNMNVLSYIKFFTLHIIHQSIWKSSPSPNPYSLSLSLIFHKFVWYLRFNPEMHLLKSTISERKQVLRKIRRTRMSRIMKIKSEERKRAGERRTMWCQEGQRRPQKKNRENYWQTNICLLQYRSEVMEGPPCMSRMV